MIQLIICLLLQEVIHGFALVCLKRIKTDGFLAEFNKTNAEYKEQKTGFQTEKKIAITAHVRPLFA